MRSLLYILLIAFAGYGTRAQTAHVDARLDTTDILIGDQIDLNIHFSMPLDYRVLWPFYKDTLTAGIEIIRQSPVDTLINESDNLVNMLQSITITAFDSGAYYIPPLRFRFQPIDDTSFYEASSIPLYLRVHTMEVDTTQAIKAIKPPLAAPVTFAEILPWLLIGLAAVALILLIIYIIRKRKKKEPIFQFRPKPVLPPHVVAISALEVLKQKKLWQAGLTKDFYTELTDILRAYIEGRYGVQAAEMTTEEILEGLKKTNAGDAAVGELARTLILADLVKFAKEQPLPVDNDNSLLRGIDFVNKTKPLTEVVDKTGDENTIEETQSDNKGN